MVEHNIIYQDDRSKFSWRRTGYYPVRREQIKSKKGGVGVENFLTERMWSDILKTRNKASLSIYSEVNE